MDINNMSNSFRPVQYSLNPVVEMKDLPKHQLLEGEDDEHPQDDENGYSFSESSLEPLLNLEVSHCVHMGAFCQNTLVIPFPLVF